MSGRVSRRDLLELGEAAGRAASPAAAWSPCGPRLRARGDGGRDRGRGRSRVRGRRPAVRPAAVGRRVTRAAAGRTSMPPAWSPDTPHHQRRGET